MLFFPAIAVLALFSYAYAEDDRGDLCQGGNDISFRSLPDDVKPGFVSILLNAANALGGSCVGVEPNYNKVELFLYTNSSDNYTQLDPKYPTGIDNNAPLYILTHGWLSGVNGYKVKAFRQKYVELYGKNVIFVNWGKLAWYPYPTTACNIPFMGQYVANFLCTLNERQNYDLSKVHVIGHSFGAQLAGFVGKGTQKTCNKKIGRITALDPAGPIYQFSKEKDRVNPTDADFVEVVHTNSGFFGYLGKSGTVDYHLNCGTLQPGCIIPEDFSKIAEASIYMLTCPHMRALEIWPYVIQSTDFVAKSCKWCPFIIPGTCFTNVFGADYVTMGHTYTKTASEQYNIMTPPYAPFNPKCFPLPWRSCT